jgi:hypothetical protein
LAAQSGRPVPAVAAALGGDPQVRSALQWAGLTTGVAWCSGFLLRVQRRRRSHRQPRKEQS